jgi:hypothetical protein
MTPPSELAEAVARLRALFAGTGWGPSRDDFAVVEAALAEAQRENDAWRDGSMQAVDMTIHERIRERDAAQAEAAKFREALAGVMSDLDQNDWRDMVSDRILTIVVEERHAEAAFAALAGQGTTESFSETDALLRIRALSAALAAPPSTAATPEGK